jgi:hypothetical protein
MTRQFTIVQCPQCHEYTYFPTDGKNHKCPRCNAPVDLKALQGISAGSAVKAQQAVEVQQYALHNVRPPATMAKACSPTSEVLRLLRRQPAGSPQWVAIVEVVQHCAKLGLSSQQVQAAIAGLVNQGFLELREGSIRVISIS